MPPGPPEGLDEDLVGLDFGPYRAIRKLGAGGMAEVYLCEDTRGGERRAIKVLHAVGSAASFRFKREHRALARLDHPHVVRVFELGTLGDRAFIVMEYVEGRSILGWLNREVPDLFTPARVLRAVELACQVCEALDHVHGHHIVHRDLKPDNILVTLDGHSRLLDFGVAKEMGEGADVTEIGMVLGTLAYASPEQVSGREVDHRSDLYALGVVLYELLTGERPFVAEHVAAYIVKHITESPMPPRRRNPVLPASLDQLILALLEKRPQDRPASALVVARALRQAAEGLGRTLGPASSPRRQEALSPERAFLPAFTGRERERARFARSLDEVAAGQGGVLVIAAEPGLGRGRLLQEIAADARLRGVRPVPVRFQSETGRPWGAWDDLARRVGEDLGAPERDALARDGRPALRAVIQALPSLGIALHGEEPADLEGEEEAELRAQGLALLLSAAGRGPRMIVLDEAHRADAASIELLTRLTRSGADLPLPPILWVISLQGSELEALHPLHRLVMGPDARWPLLSLQPLSPGDVARMVESMLGRAGTQGDLAGRLHQVTGGNPLFLSETIRALVEAGQLRVRADSSVGPSLSAAGPLELPASLDAVLEARLGHLSAESLRSLTIAAVLGRWFPPELLGAVAALEEGHLLDFCDEMLHRRLLVERQLGGRLLYGFRHPRIRQVAYLRLSEAARRGWHAEAAAHLVRLAGDEAPAELVAAHLEAAGDLAGATAHLVGAAERSQRLGRLHEALRLLRRGQDCAEGAGSGLSPQVRFELDLRLGMVLGRRGEVEEALEYFRACQQLANQDGWEAQQAVTWYQLGRLYGEMGDFERASRFYFRAVGIQGELPDLKARLRSINGLAGALWQTGDAERAERLFVEARILAQRVGDLAAEATAINGLGLLQVVRGEFEASMALFVSAADMYRRGGWAGSALQCEINAASSQLKLGELGPAHRRLRQTRDALEQEGQLLAAATARLTEGQIALELRGFREVEEALEATASALRSHRPLTAAAELLQARLEAELGRWGEAAQRLSHALGESRATKHWDQARECLIRLGEVRLAIGSPGEARPILEEALLDAEARKDPLHAAHARLLLAQACHAQGEVEAAHTYLGEATAFLRAKKVRLLLLQALLVEARLAVERAAPEEARYTLEEALGVLGPVRAGLRRRERLSFDRRPDVRDIARLWRRVTPGA